MFFSPLYHLQCLKARWLAPLAIALILVTSATLTKLTASIGGPAEIIWPMVGYDAGRTGRSPYAGTRTNTLKWHHETSSNVSSSPAIGADGAIYFADAPYGTIYAVNPDGTEKWHYDLDGTLFTGNYSSPAIGQDGTVYIGSIEADFGIGGDSHFYALNPDGTLKWRYPAGPPIWSSPAIGTDDVIYFGGEGAELYALNPDGSLKWQTQLFFPGTVTSPAIGPDGMVLAATSKHTLHAVDPENGDELWEYRTGGFDIGAIGHYSPAVADDGTIYIGSSDDYLYAVNPDGTFKWRYPMPLNYGEGFHLSPAIGLDGTVYFGDSEGNFYALNPNGTEKWTVPISYPDHAIHASPTIAADGTIYFAGKDSHIRALNPDGTELWSNPTFGSPDSEPAIGVDGTVYIGSGDGLVAFGDKTTSQNWLYLPLLLK